jgi:hypothetical protein
MVPMIYIEAPKEYKGKKKKSLFLAGSISGARNWQLDLVKLLKDEDIVIFNPRRKKFPHKENAAKMQIKWEHRHLQKSDAISFWLSKETLSPITLYELGAWSMTSKKIFIGVDPLYKRSMDVEIQTKLVRPNVKIVWDLKSLASLIKKWTRE